jgi:glutamyl-tRNA synthetase
VPRYGHIALVLGAGGAVLSKRDGAFSVRELRHAGYLPLAIVNYLARLGHTYDDNALLPLDALARAFDSARLHKAPAHFDAAQLLHWQRLAVQGLDDAALWSWLAPAAGDHVPADQHDAFAEAIRGNIVFPDDAREWAVRIFDDPVLLDDAAEVTIRNTESAFFSAAETCARDHRAFADFAAAVSTTTQRKGKLLYQPLRAALTGATHGPEMPRLFALLGSDRVQSRLIAARKIADAAHS